MFVLLEIQFAVISRQKFLGGRLAVCLIDIEQDLDGVKG